jgi:predicted DNA-binding protein
MPKGYSEGKGILLVLQLCYDRVMSSTTSSFRISDELRMRFESAASKSGKGKNWILNQALREYLDRMREDSLAAEARRQSLLASGRDTPEAQFWASRTDDPHWI